MMLGIFAIAGVLSTAGLDSFFMNNWHKTVLD
jgi:hypothetical protein